MKAPTLQCGRKSLPRLVGHGIFLIADTFREWKKSDTQRHGKTGKIGVKRGHFADEAGERHCGRPITGSKQCRKELKDSGNHKKHSRLKEHGNDVHFDIARAHRKIVPAVELHKR